MISFKTKPSVHSFTIKPYDIIQDQTIRTLMYNSKRSIHSIMSRLHHQQHLIERYLCYTPVTEPKVSKIGSPRVDRSLWNLWITHICIWSNVDHPYGHMPKHEGAEDHHHWNVVGELSHLLFKNEWCDANYHNECRQPNKNTVNVHRSPILRIQNNCQSLAHGIVKHAVKLSFKSQ